MFAMIAMRQVFSNLKSDQNIQLRKPWRFYSTGIFLFGLIAEEYLQLPFMVQ